MLLSAKDPGQLYELDNKEEPLAEQIALDRSIAPYQYNTYQYGAIKELNHNIMLMDMLMYNPDDILVKVDRSAMAVSLETRVPLLDKDVVEFAWRLPIGYKKRDGVTKKVLRDILYKRVPKELMERPKKGFSIPIAKWLKEPVLQAWAAGLLEKEKIRREGLLNPETVDRIWKDFTERGLFRVQIWYLLMFEEWYEKEYRAC